jgi:DNA-binding MarR family transcriptional regulator
VTDVATDMTAGPVLGAAAAGGPTMSEAADLAASLRIAVMRLSRRIRVERSGDDLTFNQLSVLGTLSRYGALPVGELAAHENVKPPSMTRTVACLEELGLITREPSPTDGRQVVVALTDHARRVIDADRQRRDAWLAQQLSALDPAAIDTLRAVAPILEGLAAS